MKPKIDSVANFIALLEILQGWFTAKRLKNFADDRTLRALANASEGKIITGQQGYKAACYATPEEISRKAARKRRFSKHIQPHPTYDHTQSQHL